MRRIVTNEKEELDFGKIFWLAFWISMLITQLCVVDHLSSIGRSLRIMSAINSSQPTIVVPAAVVPPVGTTVTIPKVQP